MITVHQPPKTMKVDIHGTPWTVKVKSGKKLDAEVGEDQFCLGRTIYAKHVIKMRRGIDRDNFVQTARHELTHAFLFEYGVHLTDEETICDFIGAFGADIVELANNITEFFYGEKQ